MRRTAQHGLASIYKHVTSVAVPVRQWVCSLPHQLCYVLGYDRKLCAPVLHAIEIEVQALCERRPQRPAHSTERAATMLAEEAAAGRLDRAAVSAVLEAAGHVRRVAAPNDLTARESEILQLLASGLVDKEIAAQLGISHRTVHHHNQSIFGKIGVSTRGAAALFAIEKGLV